MNGSRQNYSTELLWVTIGHGLAIGMLLAIPMIHGCEGPMTDMSAPIVIVEPPPSDAPDTPTEVMKDVPAPPEVKPEMEEPKEAPHADPDEVPILDKPKDKPKVKDPKVKPEVKPKEKPKPEVKPKGGIKISHTLVKRMPNGKGKLTPEEVRKLLERGARLGNHSSLSEADMRRLLNGNTQFGNGSPISQEFVVLDMVRQAMYRAWDQPTNIGIAGLVTKVELTFSSSGSITDFRMVSSSGNKTMDASVMRAVQSVRHVAGLPASFLSTHRRIPVSFELTGNN